MNVPTHCFRALALTLAAFGLGGAMISPAHAAHSNRIFAVQNRASTPAYQLFLNLRSDSSTAASGPLYLLTGGVYGLDFLGNTLYGSEYLNGTNHLVTIPHEGASAGIGARVSGNSIGFPNVEGLAVANGVIYATSLDFSPPHVTRLITINHVTGIGTLVGTMSPDIMIVGLAYDPFNQVMYGAGIPYATVPVANLYRINRANAQATLIGPLGAKVEGLSWDVTLGLIGSFAKLYRINPQTGAATQIGTNDFTAGLPGTFNGIYGLAGYVPTYAGPLTLRLLSASGGNLVFNWNSISNVTYVVESRGNVSSGTWSNLSPSLLAPDTNTFYTNVGGGGGTTRHFRLRTVPMP